MRENTSREGKRETVASEERGIVWRKRQGDSEREATSQREATSHRDKSRG